MPKRTYLITGGAGFIGTNLVLELVKREERVIVFDNLSTGDLKNLDSVKDKIKFIKGDIRDLNSLKLACKNVDFIIHLAALRAVGRSVDDPVSTNEVNISGTLNVLIAARDSRVKRVVSASSSSVYGGEMESDRNIETQPLNPQSPYALTKLAGEYYARLFYQLYGLETVSLRYFNVFGPFQNPESKYAAVIPIFVQALLENRKPEIEWHGDQSRDFTFVKNAVEANILASLAPTKNVAGNVYNIANGENISINDLLKEIENILKIFIEPIYKPKRAGDVLKSFADISKAKKDFGYEPLVNFKEGLNATLLWMVADQYRKKFLKTQ